MKYRPASSTPSTAAPWPAAKTSKPPSTNASGPENSGSATGSKRRAPSAVWCTISNKDVLPLSWASPRAIGRRRKRRMAISAIPRTWKDGADWRRLGLRRRIDICCRSRRSSRSLFVERASWSQLRRVGRLCRGERIKYIPYGIEDTTYSVLYNCT